VIGGLCGSFVGAGVFALRDHGRTKTETRTVNKTTVVRTSKGIGQAPDIASITSKVEPAVVALTRDAGLGRTAAGTGFVISSDGYLVTNAHVVGNASQVTADFNDGRSLNARVVGRDRAADIALLKVDATGLPVAELGNSDKVQVGDSVVAIGNALALEGGLSVTEGIISGPPREVSIQNGTRLENALQTDAAINPGNSGGPLVDSEGKVIAINTAGANPAETSNVSFAIPISHAKPIIDDLKAGRKPAFLGVGTDTITSALAKRLDLGNLKGAVVTDVTSGSPADGAGIQTGDVIVQIGDVKIAGTGDIQTAVRKHHAGDKVTVAFVRNGTQKSVDVTLTERPDVG
jgi:S1-C subfamily serine protease